MTEKPLTVVLFEKETDDGESTLLEAYFADNGSLVLAGSDYGESV